MKNFQKLLLGSAVTNQMIADIKQVTESIIGMIDLEEVDNTFFVRLECGKNYWQIERYLRIRHAQHSESKLMVEFWAEAQPRRLIYSTNPTSQREPMPEDTLVTWNALEDLVAHFMQFRSFNKKSKPLFNAAEMAEKVTY